MNEIELILYTILNYKIKSELFKNGIIKGKKL